MVDQKTQDKPSKTVIRKQLRERLKHLANEGRNDDRIVEHIRQLAQWKRAGQVFAFIPFPSEPDITPLLDLGLEQGKKVLVPVCEENGIMRFTPLSKDWRNTLQMGKHSILCPMDDEETSETPKSWMTPLILVPGLGYTKEGARIGRGGGYYDRYLQTWGDRMFKVGVCHRIQLLTELPVDFHDQMVDIVVAE